jgi:6-phosphofructokinase
MHKLPAHLVAQDFPASLSAKGQKTWDVSKQVLANLSALGIEHLIAIGGDDTLGYAAKLNELGVKIIAIPKTMDNDVRNTEYCIGFSTAITRASDAIQRQRTRLVRGVARVNVYGQRFSASISTPGRALPSSHSRKAPPAVET